MTLAYEWWPDHADRTHRPEPGQIIGFDHAVWRVIDVQDVPEVDWTDEQRAMVARYKPELRHRYVPHVAVVRPVHITTDDPRAADHDLHLESTDPSRVTWFAYRSEHYPVCGICAEPLPCRDQEAARVGEQEMLRLARYETPGVCPACLEPVTARQKSVTFARNTVLPGVGPPVTFHLRGGCGAEAARYDQHLAADPAWRPVLWCPHTAVIHPGAGMYECAAGADCPGAGERGPSPYHSSLTACQHAGCREHPGGFGGTIDAHARHVSFTGGTSGGEVA